MLVIVKPPVFACRGRRHVPCIIPLPRPSPRTMPHGSPGRTALAHLPWQVMSPRVFPSCINRLGYKGGSSTMAGAVLVLDFAAYHALIHLQYFFRVIFHP